MDIERVRSLAGTNIWANFPVTEVWLDLSGIAPGELANLCGRIKRGLATLLPACRLPTLDTASDATVLETWLARSFARLTLALGGASDGFLRVQRSTQPGLVIVALADRRGLLAPAYADTALSVLTAVGSATPFDLEAIMADMAASAELVRPTPSAIALAGAARARGIPVRHLGTIVLQLGQGAKQVRTWHGESLDSAAVQLTHERALMADLLASVGVRCTPTAVTGAHYRVLVAGGRAVAAVGWAPSNDGTGLGHITDLGRLIHPEVCARALDTARALGLDIAEVRLAVNDPSQPLEAQDGRVSEVVAGPALDAYLGLKTRDGTLRVTDALIEALFPAGDMGRIPVAAVTGTNGKTTVTRLLAHAMAINGLHVGMTCTDGIYLGGRRIDTDDCAGPQSARLVLLNPQVEAAVLETARGGILREGLAFDACDLAVVTNIGEGDHIGIGGVETLEQLAAVKQTVVRAVATWGTAVLNAADPLVAAMAKHCRGSVLFFARDEHHAVLARHRRRGGRCAFTRDETLILAEGATEIVRIALAEVPLTHSGRIGFQVENVLACVGGLWALGLPWNTIRAALSTFGADTEKSPGRFNMLDLNGATAIFDYGHNPSSLLAMVDALANFPHRRRIAVYSAAGDRRDIDMIRQGQILGDAFDEVILYEDHYTRGRLPGEIMTLFHQGLGTGRRVTGVQAIHGWQNAVETALWAAQPGDLLLVQGDRIDETVAYVRDRLAADQAHRELPMGRAELPFESGSGARDQSLS